MIVHPDSRKNPEALLVLLEGGDRLPLHPHPAHDAGAWKPGDHYLVQDSEMFSG